MVYPIWHVSACQQRQVCAVAAGDQFQGMPGDAAAFVTDTGQHLHLLPGGHHPAEAREIGSQTSHLQVGQVGDACDDVDGTVRPHSLTQVTDVDHHHHLVPQPSPASGP